MKAKLLSDESTVIRDGKRRIIGLDVLPAGTVIDHPQAWRLVGAGVAEPYDKECDERCPRTEAQRVAAHLWQVKQKALQEARRLKANTEDEDETDTEDDDE